VFELQTVSLQQAYWPSSSFLFSETSSCRYSSLTGNLVPSLPSNLIRQLFKSFATPNAGLATASQAGSKGKVKVENIALEAVEDL
jgi:hypothetical protein